MTDAEFDAMVDRRVKAYVEMAVERAAANGRPVTQLATGLHGRLCALCADGTMWAHNFGSGGWVRLPPIPHGEK